MDLGQFSKDGAGKQARYLGERYTELIGQAGKPRIRRAREKADYQQCKLFCPRVDAGAEVRGGQKARPSFIFMSGNQEEALARPAHLFASGPQGARPNSTFAAEN